ncbi:MAG: hypothetical protein UIM53_10490 [Acutalibacteraceae bacterium]|nr:hypothetical protein [Acutalibacteraceae bacterium]
MNKRGNVLAIVIAIILVILLAFGIGIYIIYKSATDLSQADKLNTTESTTIYEPLVKSIILGEEQTITDNDVNGIIAKLLNEYTAKLTETDTKNSLVVKRVAVYMQNNSTAKLYADLHYNQFRFIFTADANITLDNDNKLISIDVSNTKIGTLSIPTDFIMSNVSDSLKQISPDIQVSNNTIIVPSEYTFEFMKKEITLYISKLTLSEGLATVQTNSAMDVIGQFIDEFISSLITPGAV